MSQCSNETVTVEIGAYLGQVVDNWCHAEQCRSAAQVLQMPEEECEDQTNAEAHEPDDKEERHLADCGQRTQYRHPLG